MPAFNIGHEQGRLEGLREAEKFTSVKTSIETYLNERYQQPSTFRLQIDGRRLMAQGYEHRGDVINSFKKSVEEAESDPIARRYKLENRGFEAAKQLFFNSETVLMFSPPPKIPIKGYPGHSMMYLYTIVPHEGGDTNMRTVKALAMVNHFSLEEQAAMIDALRGEEKVKTLPTEESIMTNPIGVSQTKEGSIKKIYDILDKTYAKQLYRPFSLPSFEALNDHLFHGEDIWKNKYPDLAAMTHAMAERIITGQKEHELGKDWDVMLNLAEQQLRPYDHAKKGLSIVSQQPNETRTYISNPSVPVLLPRLSNDIFIRYQHLSFQPRVMDTSCGVSAGFGVYGNNTVNTSPNMVSASFSMVWGLPMQGERLAMPTISSGERTLKCEKCPVCNAKDIEAKIANGKITCPVNGCSAPYAC